MSHFYSLTSGRLLVRNTTAQQAALVGVVELPRSLLIHENAAYLLLLRDGEALIADTPIDEGLPSELEGQGINAALMAPIWRGTRVSGALCVRFQAAFEQQYVWVVYGAGDRTIPIALSNPDAGDVWLDVRAGRVSNLAAPASSYGTTLAQMLTQYPVWPDAHGDLHSVPQHPPAWREHYLRMSQLMALCGAGEISPGEMLQQIRADPDLDRIRPWNPEPNYLRYLAALDADGALVIDAPRTAAAHHAHESRTRKLVDAACEPY